MAKAPKPQAQASWMDPADQVWLGQWARTWATDPAHRFIQEPGHPSAFEQDMLALFDAIEGLQPDIDLRIAALHQAWKRLPFFEKQWYRLKIPYLLRGASAEIHQRAHRLGTRSMSQTIDNWGRISTIVSAGWSEDWRTGKEWVGPVPGQAVQGSPPEATPAAASQAPTKKSWWRRLNGEWTDLGGGRYLSERGGIAEGPLARLIYGPLARKRDDGPRDVKGIGRLG